MNDLMNALNYINPSDLSYQEWVNVGMALKYEGFNVDAWDDWSRADSRYHNGECQKKWDSFNGADDPITGDTIFKMARENGYKKSEGYNLDWNDEISSEISNESNESNKSKNEIKPHLQIIKYLETLFEASENVGYVTESWEKNGKYLPNKGHCDRTAGRLIEELSKCDGDIGAVFGDYNEKAGAWIRFNPLDGKGVKNENVTDYRYALVECDDMDLDLQRKIIENMRLPVACLVYSGKKSIHAIVHVDADTKEEYRKRVEYIYKQCRDLGLDVDLQNKNPSRLSRMPGVLRNGKMQELLAVNIGCKNFNEWKEYTEAVNDSLPDEENLGDVWENLPELSPPLIEGILRQGHKMLLAGPSKAGKSFGLIELCIAIAEGTKWFGFQCAKGKIMYVNLEVDRPSCLHRFKDVYKSLGIEPLNIKNIDIWNLRGKSVPMDELAPKLIRRAKQKEYIAIIIDPIYKVITGDENSADQMANFCNQFDKICAELNTAVICCHHHSKGYQLSKKSMDRASGSGVFARDPDALLDMTELTLTDDVIKQQENDVVCKICYKWLERFNKLSEVSQDDMCNEVKMKDIAYKHLSIQSFKRMSEEVDIERKKVQGLTAWRIEGTLREFAKFSPINLWFKYPIHTVDESCILKDLHTESNLPNWQKAVEKHKNNAKDKKEETRIEFENAVNFCNNGEAPTVKQIAECLKLSTKTIKRYVSYYGYVIDKNTNTVVKCDNSNTGQEH